MPTFQPVDHPWEQLTDGQLEIQAAKRRYVLSHLRRTYRPGLAGWMSVRQWNAAHGEGSAYPFSPTDLGYSNIFAMFEGYAQLGHLELTRAPGGGVVFRLNNRTIPPLNTFSAIHPASVTTPGSLSCIGPSLPATRMDRPAVARFARESARVPLQHHASASAAPELGPASRFQRYINRATQMRVGDRPHHLHCASPSADDPPPGPMGQLLLQGLAAPRSVNVSPTLSHDNSSDSYLRRQKRRLNRRMCAAEETECLWKTSGQTGLMAGSSGPADLDPDVAALRWHQATALAPACKERVK